MSGLNVPVAITFSEAELERITNLNSYDLRKHQPEGFGMPGHWFPNSQGHLVYTERGAEDLALSMETAGLMAEALCIRAELKIRRETPSAALIPPISKNDPEPYYRRGSMA